ncbi:MAG: elongation factor [Alphaproteobacteria bacterium]|nr:elongation factor [Alphaproteobacteria bacterium]
MTNPANASGTKTGRGPRAVALCGPYLSGKTSLMESLLFAASALPRKGSVREKNLTGDGSPESRARQMTIDVNVAQAEWMGETFHFLDCPGSIEFQHETACTLMAADAAIVVCEPDPARVIGLAPLLRFLEERHIPHLIFVNKMENSSARVRDLLAALQTVSNRKLILRQVPMRKAAKDGVEEITGYVDLVSERAYRYMPGRPSDLIEMPQEMLPRESEARREMLEALADYDDRLLEQLLDDVAPEKSTIYRDLREEFGKEQIVPVLLGSAERDHGIQRLWKALRHDVPSVTETAKRRGLAGGGTVIEVFKTLHQPHTGKMSLARVWQGNVTEGKSVGSQRIGALYRLQGSSQSKLPQAEAGAIVGLAKLDTLASGQVLGDETIGDVRQDWPTPPTPVFSLTITPRNRTDDVKLSAALHKLREEDAGLLVEHRPESSELVLSGQGEIHLQVAIERLGNRYNVPVSNVLPKVAYRETIRRGARQHGRHKRQTGGHGQFGDVHIDIQPLQRGAGIQFNETIVGGSVPRQYIPGVEAGVRDYMKQGPLGFPVVDVSVTLTDGSYHNVDSSEQAFRQAARIALSEAMPKCEPVLLEPILKVTFQIPNEATAKVQRLISTRRGQILGFDARSGWRGWDEVSALIPESEMAGLIVEIRSLSFGVGTYRAEFDHLQELGGKLADRARQQATAAA